MAAMSEQEYKALAVRAYEAFKNYPNVHGVALGSRERKGQPTGELTVRVFVRRKLSTSALPREAVIPAEFEGIPTDVVEMSEPELIDLSDIPGMRANDTDEDKDKYRPLKGGIQIEGNYRQGLGTLGFLTKVQGDNRVMAVTCFHVMFDNSHAPQVDMRVGNPDPDESCTKCCIGAFGRHVAQDYTTVDAAISKLDPNTEWLAEIQCIGYITGWATPITVAQAHARTYRVRKYGRTTRLTGGVVTDVNYVGSISDPSLPTRAFTNGIVIQPNPVTDGSKVKFGDHGDSGSGFVNDANEIVGVLFGVVLNQTNAAFGTGFGFPVQDMAARFLAQNAIQLIPATATSMGDVQTTPAAAGRPADVVPTGDAEALARRLEADLARSARGRVMTELWLRHSSEVNRLVNHNRRVATLWQRNSGPAIFQSAIRAAKTPEFSIPAVIDGHPVDERIENIMAIFERYGSDGLKNDIHAHRLSIPPLAGRSYQELIEIIRDRG